MWLLLAFIAVPMIEIGLFIQVGGAIGLGWTLLIVLLTALLGTWLVRAQGALALQKIRRSFNELSDPSQPLADGAMILVAGVLLLTPGFFTDAVGFALLTPPVRRAVFGWVRKRVTVHSALGGGGFARPAPGQPRPARPAPGVGSQPRPQTGSPAGSAAGPQTGSRSGSRPGTGPRDVIEGEYSEVDPDQAPKRPSDWTRH